MRGGKKALGVHTEKQTIDNRRDSHSAIGSTVKDGPFSFGELGSIWDPNMSLRLVLAFQAPAGTDA